MFYSLKHMCVIGSRFFFRVNFRLVCCFAGIATFPVHANWNFTPRVLVAEAYTDNRFLAPAEEEESVYITQIIPGFSLARANNNFRLNLDYQLEGVFYENSLTDTDNEVFQQIGLTASQRLAGDWAVFDVAATRTQAGIDARRVTAGNNLFSTTNRTNVSTLSYGPVFRWQPRSYILGELNFQYGVVKYDAADLANSEQWRGRLLIDASRSPGKIGWTFQHSALRTKNDLSSIAVLQRTSADIYFYVAPRTALIAGTGWDNNRFPSSIDSEQRGGSWRVGFQWAPRRRTNIAVFYNDRYFGQSAEFRISNESRYMDIAISYQEDIESLGQGRIANLVDSVNPTLPVVTGTISNEVSEIRRGAITVLRRHGKTETSLVVDQYSRKLQVSLLREDMVGVRVGWQWRVSSRTTFDISGRRQKLEFSDVDRTDYLKLARVALSYRFGRRIDFESNFGRTSRTSSDGSVGYVSNTFMFSVSATF